MINKLADSELVLNDDGSVYHLNLLPEDLAEKVILVGDPDRVPKFQSISTPSMSKRIKENSTRTPELCVARELP